MNQYRHVMIAALGALAIQTANAQVPNSQKPLLIIGASYAEAKTPFNNGIAPLGGVAVKLGSYLSLGNALVRNKKLPGYVINEAQAGGGTFARLACATGTSACGPAGWDSYQTQLERAIARVATPPTFTQLNAKYVVIVKSNDCLHADAFGVPQAQAQPCTRADMEATVDRLIAVGQHAIDHGLTPVYDIPPAYSHLDLPLFKSRYNLAWVIGEGDYNLLRSLHATRIATELPGAIVLDMWRNFVHGGDGIHPSDDSNADAANMIAKQLVKLDE
jgi:hypothetical protein